jgi:hypothetical protein
MRIHNIRDFSGGWVVGNFTPSLLLSEDMEVAVKAYSAGDREALHFQKQATEITILISGFCRLGAIDLKPGDIAAIPPMEAADFLALSDCVLVAIKSPSKPDDKFLGAVPCN